MSPLLNSVRRVPLDDVALILGALLVVTGCWVLAPWLGLVVAGAVLVAGGYFLGGEG